MLYFVLSISVISIAPQGTELRVKPQCVRIISGQIQRLIGQCVGLIVLLQRRQGQGLLHHGADVFGIQAERPLGDLNRALQILLARLLKTVGLELTARFDLFAAVVCLLNDIRGEGNEFVRIVRILPH